MAVLDLIILAVLALGFFRGWKTGLIIQVSSLAALILAFVAAALLMRTAGTFAEEAFGLPEGLGPFVAFMGIFIAVRVGIMGIGMAARSLIGKLKLSGLDRVTGGAAGLLKAAVLLSVAFLVLGYVELPGAEARRSSELYRPVYELVPDAWRVISNGAPAFEEFRRDVEERLDFDGSSVPV